MNLLSFIFSTKGGYHKTSGILLLVRLVFGLLLANHGFEKFMNFSAMSAQFPDPLGIGNELSMGMAVFGELVCSLAVVAGLFTRLAIIPIIFTMIIAFFVVHGGSIAEGELAFAYLVVYVLLFLAGPGKFSFDAFIESKLEAKENNGLR